MSEAPGSHIPERVAQSPEGGLESVNRQNAEADSPSMGRSPEPHRMDAPNVLPERVRPAAPVGSPPPAIARVAPALDPELAREIEAAYAEMDSQDLAELSGQAAGAPAAGAAAGSRRGGAAGSATRVEPGDRLTGLVVGVTDDEVFLDFGIKSPGLIPRLQCPDGVERGDKLEVVVNQVDEAAGLVHCRMPGKAQDARWDTLAPGMVVEGRISGMNKGGLEVDLKGIRAFLPASQASNTFLKDVSVLIGELVLCEVVEVDRKRKNVTVSRRKVLEREAEAKRGQVLQELEVGQVRRGVIRNIMEYGAFVDIGGVDGLVHIGDLSWHPVQKVSDVVEVGQTVEVKVLKIDHGKDRISLGLKQVTPDPWTAAMGKYTEGSQHRVEVVRLADFGAFAELEPGIDGLIPISEMSWGRVASAGDVVKVGDRVDVKIIRVEENRRRIALSIKQATADPWAGVADGYEPNSKVKGKVTRLESFGVFVQLVPGVEGLIHISELSDKHVKSCSEVVAEGQEVDARVLGVDKERRRISLSLKPAPAEAPAPTEAVGSAKPQPKKKSKARRGGLDGDWNW